MVRANTNVTHKDRRQLRLGGFLGADYSSSPFQVSTARATKMKNLINEYGVNRKRRGWRQVKQFFRDINNQLNVREINGIFRHVWTDGSAKKHYMMLVIAGNALFAFYTDENGEIAVPEALVDSEVNSNQRPAGRYNYSYNCNYVGSFLYNSSATILAGARAKCTAFEHNGRVYFIGMGFYTLERVNKTFSLRRVDETDVYIPTTSININHDGYADSEENGKDVRAALEDANRLTAKRKNELVGKVPAVSEDGTKNYTATWTLDAEIDANKDITIEVETLNADGQLVTNTYVKHAFANSSKEEYKEYREKLVRVEGEGNYSAPCGSYTNRTVTLDCDTTPPVGGSGNMVVTFSTYQESESPSINSATCGTLFGADGNSDRLFLGGLGMYGNVEYYSEPDDFTYFPYRNTLTVGTGESRIIGYQRLGDGTLAIFKEKSGSDASVFFRSGSTVTEYEGGTVSDMYAAFKTTAAGIGEALVSPYALGTLGGDVLMLSENGVYGMVLGTNAATNERYTRERSRSINAALTKHNLKNAVSVVYKDKYYLAVDGICYVADARFTYAAENALDGAYNYEWWVWDNIPARCFAVIGDKLYFGTEDGKLCVFDDEYADRQRYETLDGQIEISSIENELILGLGLFSIASGKFDTIQFKTPLFTVVHRDCEVVDGKIIIPGSKVYVDEYAEHPEYYSPDNNIVEGLAVVPTDVGESGLLQTQHAYSVQKYEIVNVNRGGIKGTDENGREWIADCYQLKRISNNSCINLMSGGFSLNRDVSGKPLYAEDTQNMPVYGRRFYILEREGGKPLALSQSVKDENGASKWPELIPDFTFAILEYSSPVVSEWYSPIMDLGTNVYSKSLTRLTVSTEPTVNGNITVGYETRAVSRELGAKGLDIFDFNSLTFESFAFDTGFASSYTTRLRERNFNYIIFRFISETPTDCAVNDMTIEYKINKLNTGVK